MVERKKPYTLESVEHALMILESFSADALEVGVLDLSRRLGLGPSTIHRLLATLQGRGFIQQNPTTKKYSLGLKAFEVGSLAINQSLREAATPWLEELMRESGQTAHLCIRDRNDIIYIERVESARPIMVRTPVGARSPVFCTATGKAMLAFEDPSLIESVVVEGLPCYTGTTVTTVEALLAQLEAIRRVGYALNDGELREEVAAVGAPVRDYTRKVVAGVGVAMPRSDFTPEVGHRLGQIVVAKAARISAGLGFASGVTGKR